MEFVSGFLFFCKGDMSSQGGQQQTLSLNTCISVMIWDKGLGVRQEHLHMFTWRLCAECELMAGDTAPLSGSSGWIGAADR